MINIKTNSKKVLPGDTFVALRGIRNDGHYYIDDAIKRGAKKIIAEEGNYSVSYEIVDNTREYLNNLTKYQRDVAYLIMDGYSCEEIKEILHMEQSEFTNCMNGLKAYRNISILF